MTYLNMVAKNMSNKRRKFAEADFELGCVEEIDEKKICSFSS